MRQNPLIRPTVAAFIGCAIMAGSAASVNANTVTVTDVTDWSTTPVELVDVNIPYLGLPNGINVYAGINTLSITEGSSSSLENAFCIDPFHWSGTTSPYTIVPLQDAPKAPAPLNSFTATEIEDLWAMYYSPTMSSPSAAALQIAIWELVSSNAVANDGLPSNEAFSVNVSSSDYGAGNDLAALATYKGQPADLIAVTGPGQDFVYAAVPDGGETFLMLTLTFGALVVVRPALIKCSVPLRKAKALAANRR